MAFMLRLADIEKARSIAERYLFLTPLYHSKGYILIQVESGNCFWDL